MKNKQKKDRYIIYMNIIYIIYLYVRIRVHTKSVCTFYDKEGRGARAGGVLSILHESREKAKRLKDKKNPSEM